MALSLKVLGAFSVRDEAGQELSLPTRKTRALLAYLAVHVNQPQLRERLTALFWSDREDRQARQSLNQALRAIRRLGDEAGVTLLHGDLERVTLDGDALESDVVQFRALLAEEPAEAVQLYAGPFLDGLSIPDPAFEEWLTAMRGGLHAEVCDGLRRAADAAAEGDNSDQAIAMTQRLVSLDPLQEDAHRRLMRYLYDAGDRVGALRQYQACADILQEELHVEPDAATKALFEEIRQDTPTPETAERPPPDPTEPIAKTKPKDASKRRWLIPAIAACGVLMVGAVVLLTGDWFTPKSQPVASVAEPEQAVRGCPTLEGKPTIAVLPFVNLSGDPKEEYLSDGISEDLITRLAKRPDMVVTARTTSFAFKGKSMTVEEIGRKLGVSYVLEGSVQKAEDRIRITAQLIDAATSNHLWAERYDRELKDLFAMQDEITHRVAVETAVKLTKGEVARINFKSTNNFMAYEYFLRGKEFRDKRSKKNNEHARKLFEQAIKLDPQFARAIATLGYIFEDRRYHGNWGYDPEQSLKRAEELAREALEIDKDSATARALLGSISAYKGQYEQAIIEGRRAVAIEPNNPGHRLRLTWLFLFAGRPKDATDVIADVRCLSPYPTNGMLTTEAQTHYLSGRYDATISTSRELLARKGRINVSRRRIIASYMALGREEEARAEAIKYNEYYMKRFGKPYSLKKRIKQLKRRPWKDKSWMDVYAERLRKAGIPD